MNSAIIGLLGLIWFVAAYRIYGSFIEKKLVNPNNKNPTPSERLNDGIDYCPTKPSVLFGHHFSSIAGAGPIIGPVIAAHAFGFLPSILWILIGSVLVGAVHDYTAMIISVRYDGRSIPDIAKELVDGKTRILFMIFVFIALVFINAVFSMEAAKSFISDGRIVIPAFGLIPLAMLYGILVNRRGLSTIGSAAISAVLLVVLFVLGIKIPLVLPVHPDIALKIWTGILLVYGFIAAILPVWLLLQPRDFIASWLLGIGMLAGFAGLFITRSHVSSPMVMDWVSPTQGPMWPMLFILIACGAVSGFHSLVSSGTSAKQLSKESDAKPIGFGAMITEGALAMLALLAVTAGLGTSSGQSSDIVLKSFLAPGGSGAIGAFAEGFGTFTAPFLGSMGALFGMMMLNSFVLTTLDTSVRLARFISTELLGPTASIFQNRYIAAAVPVLLSFFLAATGNQTSLWPMFGAANQLIAALAMIVATVYFAKQKKPTKYTLIPAIFMWITTCGALIWKGLQFFNAGQTGLSISAVVLLILALFIGVKSATALKA